MVIQNIRTGFLGVMWESCDEGALFNNAYNGHAQQKLVTPYMQGRYLS